MTANSDDTERRIVLEEAAKLPLWDAAYVVWTMRDCFRTENGPSTDDDGNHVAFEKIVCNIIELIHKERQTADSGPCFFLLSKVHPEAEVPAIKEALRAVVKLECDGIRYYNSKDRRHAHAVSEAADRAREANPGFGERTYEALWHDLATTFR